MPASQVRQELNSRVMRVNASAAGLPCDAFQDLGIRVHYRHPDAVEAVEFGGPACPTFEGRPLLRKRYCEIEPWIQSLDPGVKLEHSGLTSNKFGFGIYAPSARKNGDAPVEVVTVFERDYYRRYMETIRPPAP